MAYCTNCGKEVPEGIKFCSNCGTPVGDGALDEEAAKEISASGNEDVRWTGVTNQTQGNTESVSRIDKYGKLIGVGLFILAIVDLFTDPPILTIILSIAIIAGAVFCFSKKYKLKGFTIAAVVISAICLILGLSQARDKGLFTIPGKTDEAVEQDTSTSSTYTESKPTEPSKSAAEDNAADNSSDETTESEQSDIDGVDPELKAFLDSYEAFVDEYVVFMKKYQSDPTNAVAMLQEYSEIMAKYNDFAVKVEQYDSEEMSPADAKYYLEVTSRCSQKMLDVL